MASGDYVVGRDDIDFQYAEPSSSAGSVSSSTGSSLRDGSSAKKKPKKRIQRKNGIEPDTRIGSIGASPASPSSPKRKPKPLPPSGSKQPSIKPTGVKSTGLKAKQRQVKKPAVSGSGPNKPANTRDSASSGPNNSKSPNLNIKRSSAKQTKSTPIGSSKQGGTSKSASQPQRSYNSSPRNMKSSSKRRLPSSSPSASPAISSAITSRKPSRQYNQNKPSLSSENDLNVWYKSSSEDRNRVLEFWKQLSLKEREDLVVLNKDSLFELVREQMRSCSCPVCISKREAVDEELEELYELNEPRLQKYSESLLDKDSLFIGSGLKDDVKNYFSDLKGNGEIEWDQPDFHSISRIKSSSAETSEDKIYFSGVVQNQDISEDQTPGQLELNEFFKFDPKEFADMPHLTKDQYPDTSTFPQPFAHLSNVMIDIISEPPPANIPEELLMRTREFQYRVSAQLLSFSGQTDQYRSDPDLRLDTYRQFMQLWSEMHSLFELVFPNNPKIKDVSNFKSQYAHLAPKHANLFELVEIVKLQERARKKEVQNVQEDTSGQDSHPRKTLTSSDIQLMAQEFAKPILAADVDDVPVMAMKMLTSLGPLYDAEGISLDDQRKVFFQIVNHELAGKYPGLVHDFFTEFAKDVEQNNGQNLLNMLDDLAKSSPEKSPTPMNQTEIEMANYYKQVQGESLISSLGFDLNVKVGAAKSTEPSVDGELEQEGPSEDHENGVNLANRDTNGDEGDRYFNQINEGDSGNAIELDDEDEEDEEEEEDEEDEEYDEDGYDEYPDGEDESDLEESVDEDSEEYGSSVDEELGDEEYDSDIEGDMSQFEEEESNRLWEGSWCLHFLFARILEQRVLKAYRGYLALQRQQSLLAELAEEEAKAEADAQRKQKEKDKKKSKKLAVKQQREEESQKKALEAKQKAEKAEAARAKEAARRQQQIEQDRAKQEAHRRKIEERMAQLALQTKEKKVLPEESSSSSLSPTSTNVSKRPPLASTPPQNSKAKAKVKSAEKIKPEKLEKPKNEKNKKDSAQTEKQSLESFNSDAFKEDIRKFQQGKNENKTADKMNSPASELHQKSGSLKGAIKEGLGTPFVSNTPGNSRNFVPPPMNIFNTAPTQSSRSSQLLTAQPPTHGSQPISGPPPHIPPGMPNALLSQPSSLADVSGLPSNLGGISLSANQGPNVGSNRPPPPPGMVPKPMTTGNIGAGGPATNLMNSSINNPKLSTFAPTVNSNIGSSIGLGPLGNNANFGSNTLGGNALTNNAPIGSGSSGVPLNGGNIGGNNIGMGVTNMRMYRIQQQQQQQKHQQQPQQPSSLKQPSQPHLQKQSQQQQPHQKMNQQPTQLPQFSSVSSLWSSNAVSGPQSSKHGWPRSPWAEEHLRTPEATPSPQLSSSSPWSTPAASTFGQPAPMAEISEAAKRSYTEVRHLGVDGYVPSQVLYHATQAKSGQRFSQNDLYKACSKLSTFDCLRDDVGLITHIKL